MPKVKWPKCPPPRTDYLSSEECELLLAHSDTIIGEMILTALRTGMRQGELKGLQWSSINWQNRSIALRHSYCDVRQVLDTPKSNKERYIPLDIDVYEMLHRRKESTGFVFLDPNNSKPFRSPKVNLRLAKVCQKAGLRKVTWHVLRHTFASQLAMKGVPLNTVQVLLGHSSITTTMRYAHVAPSMLRARTSKTRRTIFDSLIARSIFRLICLPFGLTTSTPCPTGAQNLRLRRFSGSIDTSTLRAAGCTVQSYDHASWPAKARG
jgi:integrase